MRDLAAALIAEENSEAILDTEKVETLKGFWEATYEPYIKESKRYSTQVSYADLWARHLEPILGPMELPAIRTRDVSLLLTDLAKKGHGRNSIAHVRSLISGILVHAVNLGLLEFNPVRDGNPLAAVKQSKPTEFYTEEEVEAIIADLEGMPDCQAVCAVLFYCGLRPSEGAALKWPDIDLENGTLTVSRSCVRGDVADQLKTPESHRSLPLVPQVSSRFAAWRKLSPGDGWVFENKVGKPDRSASMARQEDRAEAQREGPPVEVLLLVPARTRDADYSAAWSARGVAGARPPQHDRHHDQLREAGQARACRCDGANCGH